MSDTIPIVDLLKNTIKKTSRLLSNLSQNQKNELVDRIFKNLKLFSIQIDKISNKSKIRISIDLASFLLINQILIYYLYNAIYNIHQSLNILEDFQELKLKFKEIRREEFRIIFNIDLISIISDNISLLKIINDFIRELKILEPEKNKFDILGRLFQEALPNLSRKKSAAFYTRPIIAELLANLSIDSSKDIILDPACGTGTLLISSLNRKKDLIYDNQIKQNSSELSHDIIGVEIMPYAAFLATINMLLHNPNLKSKDIKIGLMDGLSLRDEIVVTSILNQIDEDKYYNKIEFKLENINVVLMNPPYTRKEILSKNIKENFPAEWEKFRSMSYWGYFLLLADKFLVDGGKVAAVIPAGFFRGSDTLDLRRYLFKDDRYRFKYIIKMVKDVAFTEYAIQRDFLIILEKKKSIKSKKFGVVYLTEQIEDYNFEIMKEIAKKIRAIPEGEDTIDKYFILKWINHTEILQRLDNLWFIVGFGHPEIQEKIYSFYKKIIQKGEKHKKIIRFFKLISNTNVLRGLEPKPAGLFKAIFLVRNLNPNRISRSTLIIEKEIDEEVQVKLKTSNMIFKIPKNCLKSGLKTHTYLEKIALKELDYIIYKNFKEFDEIKNLIGISNVDLSYIEKKGLERSAHIFIIRRFGFSEGTKLICFYSREKLIPSKNFYLIKTDPETAKILTLWFNSSFSIIQLLLTRRETGGTWGELVQEDLLQFYIPKLNNEEKKELLKIFNEVENLEFPSITKQFENCFKGREIIDRAFLKIFGFAKNEIDDTLKSLYSNVAKELRILSQIKK
ncbi:MAG: HsdM family class I SAM-dependent methyltransferase [Candidatus Helarchaeota archaeon]